MRYLKLLFLFCLIPTLLFAAEPKADKIRLDDSGSHYDNTTVEGAFSEIAGKSFFSILASDIANWTTAFGWGNHSEAGYAVSSDITNHTGNSTIHITSDNRTVWDGVAANNHTAVTVENTTKIIFSLDGQKLNAITNDTSLTPEWVNVQNKSAVALYEFGANNHNGSGNFNTTGNVTAGFFKGDGSLLTNLPTWINYTDEKVDDRVAVLIPNGTGITFTYDDAGNSFTPAVTITQYTDALAIAAVVGLENFTNYYNKTNTYNMTEVLALQNFTNVYNKTEVDALEKHHIGFTITNGTSALATGWYGVVRATNNFTATGWKVFSTDFTKGNITVAVFKFTPPAGANQNFTEANFSLCSGTENITLASAQFNEDTSLGSFNTTFVVGEYYGFNVTATDTVKQVNIVIYE